MNKNLTLLWLGLVSVLPCTQAASPQYEILDILTADAPSTSRSKEWKPGSGIPLEVSGMDWMPDGRLAVATRKGEVWMLKGVLAPTPDKVTFKLFASGLQRPQRATYASIA
jgi:hypothetical protein